MDEPNYMFLDPASLLFFTICTFSFVAGVALIDIAFPVEAFGDRRVRPRIGPVFFLLLPVLPLLALSALSIYLVLQSNPNLLELWLSQGGNEIKGGLEMQGTLGLASIYLLGVIWWVAWRSDQISLGRRQRYIVKAAQYTATTIVILSATLKLGRGELMPVITGVAVVYVLLRIIRRRADNRFAVIASIGVLGAMVTAFGLVAFVRGAADPSQLLTATFAYTISSYNRLAALLAGRLQYPHGGRGIYLFSFLGFNNVLNSVVPFREYLSWPSFYDVWQTEFQANWRAGLNGYSIWASAFGYSFIDLGWWAPVFVFFQGLLGGAAWRAAKAGRIFGIVLYPWVTFCILFWFGTNYLLDNKFVVLVVVALLLSLYERLTTHALAPALP